jgi:hypothetical protein
MFEQLVDTTLPPPGLDCIKGRMRWFEVNLLDNVPHTIQRTLADLRL